MGLFEQFPYTNFHDLNLDWVLEQIKEWGAQIEALKEFEKSTDITNNRKLSPSGNFTGTISGRAANIVLAGIDNNRNQIQYIANQFSDGQTGLVIDGGFFDESGIRKSYNGGMF